MTFTCFRDGKCEWNKGLYLFAEQFNEKFGTNYTLNKCLDVAQENRNRPQPEVLLIDDDNEKSMVVECKKIVYPENFYEEHRKLHTFHDVFSTLFNQQFQSLLPEAIYEICINKTLYQFKELDIQEKVVVPILKYIKKAISNYSLSKNRVGNIKPILWTFYQLPDCYCEPDEVGFGVRTYFSMDLLSSHINPENYDKFMIQKLQKYLNSASQKFKDYKESIKILIIELCGDFMLIDPQRFAEICRTISKPELVDQIWLAVDNEDTINYFQVR